MCNMFVNQRACGDFKENVTSLAPGEASTHNSKKELKSCSLNSFDSSTNVCDSKKTDFDLKNVAVKKELKDKEHLQPLKPKVKVPDIKVESCSDDSWSDIEDIVESCSDDSWTDIEDELREDDYPIYLPVFEHINMEDIDCLPFTPKFIEETVDRLPSPLKLNPEIFAPDICIPKISTPQFSPLILGLEQDINTRLKQDINTRLEQDITRFEQDIITRLEQDINTGLEQDINTGLEQDIDTGLEQDIDTGLEQDTDAGLEPLPNI